MLGTVAAGALLFGYGRRAYADCVGSGAAPNATLNCTGDLMGTGVMNGGINVDATKYDTLNVNNLNATITPNSPADGISFQSTTGNVTITSDADMVTVGSSSKGFDVGSTVGSITITNTGDLTVAGGNALHAQTTTLGGGDVTVYNSGNIAGRLEALSAQGDVLVVNDGTIASTLGAGIYASALGTVTVKSSGDVSTTGTALKSAAVYANGYYGGSTVTLYSGTFYGHLQGVSIKSNAGTESVLNNFATLSGGSYAVIDPGSGNTTVNNYASGLNGNQSVIGDTMNAALAAGGGGLSPVLLGLLNTPGLEAYKAALDQLSPQINSDAQIAALYASLGFANSLLSCKVNGADTAAIIREGQCLWAGASVVLLDGDTTSQQIGFDQTAGLFAAGAQVALDPVWRFGFGAGYQTSELDTATNATSDG